MSYLLTQIWICLLLTALVAGVAGWLLGRGGSSKMKLLEEKWRTKLARAENERDYYADEVKSLGVVSEERAEMEDRFAVEKEALEKELNALQKGIKFKSDSSKESEEKLMLQTESLEERNSSLNARVDEEQQIFSQRVAELEAGEELAKSQINDYEDKVTELQSQLNDAQVSLAETTNQLTEVEANLGMAESISNDRSSRRSAGVTSGVARAAIASVTGSATPTALASTSNFAKESLIDSDSVDYPLDVIETMTSDDSKRLNKLGIKTTSDLLAQASDKKSISLLAKNMGKESWVIRSWSSIADLLRVSGVDAVDAELLELSGVSTVQSLGRSKLDKLADSVKVIHRHVGKTIDVPSHAEITGWISAAATLEPMLETNVDKL